MERRFTFEEGAFYHLYNRGINKDKVFFSEDDQRLFQKLLFFRNDPAGNVKSSRIINKSLSEHPRDDRLVDICAYALMPNHFHLLVRERSKGGVSRFMSKLQTSYAKHINTKYKRSGPLMCRPYRATHVGDDAYLRWLISYIHLNPLDISHSDWKEKGVSDVNEARKTVSEYPFSSFYDYFVDERDEAAVVTKESLPFFISDLEDVNNMLELYHSNQ